MFMKKMAQIIRPISVALVGSLFSFNAAMAAIPQKVLDVKGAQVGGVAGTGFTLLGIQKNPISKGERIVLDIGTLKGEALKGWPTYYHVELKQNPRQVVVDLTQTPNTQVDDSILKNILKNSKVFGAAQILADPTEPTMTLLFNLKKEAKVKVYQVHGKKSTAKIVIDVLEK